MNKLVVTLCALLVALPVSGHLFNFTGRIDDCHSDVAPAHYNGDGHGHAHHTDAVGSHTHDGVLHGPNHTHSLHFHDPCNQIGMQRPSFQDMGPLNRTFFEDAIIRADDPLKSTVLTDSEAFVTDVQDYLEGRHLVIVGDKQLADHAAKGTIKGNGTASDPYIIEGLLIRHVLMIKDTSKCVVVRDNVIHSRALIGPLADPSQVVDLRTEMKQLEAQEDATEKALDQAKQNATQNQVISTLEQKLAVVADELEEKSAKAKQGRYMLGDHVADEVSELAWDVYDEARALLKGGAGRLILDWNGQCVHAYNNIVEDLRVNRNNKRTGYATGGIIEENRIYNVGQIRHYDGEFRENEVGWREHLWGLLPNVSEAQPPLRTMRAMNVDGFNQGWFHDNLIFGSVDLDYHGHHHGTGFFAPQSHYHGSDFRVAYMVSSTGACKYPLNGTSGPLSPAEPYVPADLPLTGEDDSCLAHLDHQKRWTSVSFEDNTVIDPFGYGVRYEDRNHQGDDRIANSEDMEVLNKPHSHRSHIRIEENVVLGSLWVDIFSSPGIEVWSDDYSEVKRDTLGAIKGAVEHLGAHPIPAHTGTKGWLDIKGNAVYTLDKPHNTPGFHYGWDGIQINHAFDAELMQVTDNKLFLLPHAFTPNHTDDDDFIADLETGRTGNVAATEARVNSWGTHRTDGPRTYGIVLHYLHNSNATVCNNHVRGYEVGFYAWNMIYQGSNVTLCGNTYGNATHQSLLRYQPAPTSPPYGLTSPLRDMTNQTSFEPLLDPVYDRADQEEAKVRQKAKPVEDYVRDKSPVALPEVL